jgi:serine/threonine protein kinase
MGSVWLARDDLLGRDVAMKRIGMVPGGATPDLQRAEREARLAARINHPHVVAVFDLVDDDGEQWLVMEYVEGVTLAGLLRREGALSPEEATPLLRQASDALAAAHAAGIIHRDVKPSNMLVGPDGQVKLSDFGIAKAEADATLTQTGLVTGSPAYISPEVASGQPATDASDVWSLGATAYHALMGRPPYEVEDGNVLGTLYRIVHEDPPRVPNPGRLGPMLDHTMTRDPADRWSMAQVHDFLAAEPQGTVVHPAPTVVAPVDPSDTWVLPPPPVVPASVPVPPASEEEVRRAGRTSSGVLPVLAALVVVLVAAVVGWAVFFGNGGSDTPAAGGASGHQTHGSSHDSSGGASDPTSPDSPSSGATEESMKSFVSDYLAAATSDQKTSWTMLTPGFQAQSGGFGQYQKFWKDHTSATVTSISADPQALTVTYRVDYTLKDGQTTTDDVQLQLEYDNGTYLIAGEPA